jgi:tetratricopeptide (TPR) repeat protein
MATQMGTNMKSLAIAMNTLAWAYNDQKNWEDASTFSEIATILVPQDANIRDTHAEMLFKNGEHDEAIKQMQKAIELEKNPDTLVEYQKKLEEYKKK